MQIEELSLTAIKPYERNPRKNEAAVKSVAESIKQFGFQQPIVVDKDNVIVVGHTRYKAAQYLGLQKVPCVRADMLTAEQVKAYRILDNKLNELATWNFEALGKELKSFDFDFTGFDVNFDFEVDFDTFFSENQYQPKVIEDTEPVEKFQVIITFDDQDSQTQLYKELKERGLECQTKKIRV